MENLGDRGKESCHRFPKEAWIGGPAGTSRGSGGWGGMGWARRSGCMAASPVPWPEINKWDF